MLNLRDPMQILFKQSPIISDRVSEGNPFLPFGYKSNTTISLYNLNKTVSNVIIKGEKNYSYSV